MASTSLKSRSIPTPATFRIVTYSAVDDCGNPLDAMVVEGQLHGSVAAGLGQALMENTVYDEGSGQLVTGSFMDYAMPRAADMPPSCGMPCTTCRRPPIRSASKASARPAPRPAVRSGDERCRRRHSERRRQPSRHAGHGAEALWEACQRARLKFGGLRDLIAAGLAAALSAARTGLRRACRRRMPGFFRPRRRPAVFIIEMHEMLEHLHESMSARPRLQRREDQIAASTGRLARYP